MRHPIAFASLFVGLLLTGESAAKKRTPSKQLSNMSIEQLLDVEITTASRVGESSGEAPATVYVISKRDIRARGYSSLSDVLKDLPGMETVENYYSEQGTLVP